MRDKHQIIEEPCEVKVSRTVLKTSGIGDNLAESNYIGDRDHPAQWYYRIRFLKCDHQPSLVGSYDQYTMNQNLTSLLIIP